LVQTIIDVPWVSVSNNPLAIVPNAKPPLDNGAVKINCKVLQEIFVENCSTVFAVKRYNEFLEVTKTTSSIVLHGDNIPIHFPCVSIKPEVPPSIS
jgi:hypothetical protein